MSKQKCQVGMIGLGTMGRNLVLNIADHGFTVAGYDKSPTGLEDLRTYSHKNKEKIQVLENLEDFINSLASPRIIMILVPAGKAVDSVIEELLPYLKQGDILIDGGNSYFLDTERRQKSLAEKGIYLLGVGISGGAEGARHGPCFMPGGSKEAYNKVQPILESIAARVLDEPCVAYIGPGGSGHYVKMIHNGIEYGLMQLISETYDILKRGLELETESIARLYAEWNNDTELNGFLIEITAQILTKIDLDTHHFLIDQIMDIAEEKGTGSWTSSEGLKLREPLLTINAAVAMRDLSLLKNLRVEVSHVLQGPAKKFKGDEEKLKILLRHALYFSMSINYIQGMSLIWKASKTYQYQLNLEKIVRIWRGGCIIRSSLLNEMVVAFQHQPHLSTLLLDSHFSQELSELQNSLRDLIIQITPLGIPIPALMASMSYYDAFRSEWLPANLIQAQRDFFGSHTYKRIDKEGIFHTQWSLNSGER